MDDMQYIEPSPELGPAELASIVWRRKWIILAVVVVCMVAAGAATRKMKPKFEAQAQMVVMQHTNSSNGSSDSNQAAPLNETPETQAAMITSAGMAERALNWLKNHSLETGQSAEVIGIDDEAGFYKDFGSAVKVDNPKDTSLLDVTVTTDSADKSKAWANAVCQGFVQWKTEIAQASIEDTFRNLQTRAERAKAQLRDAEHAETDYKKSHHVVDIPTQEKASLEQAYQRDADVAAAQQELAQQEAHLKGIASRLRDANETIRQGEGVRDDTLVASLQTQLNQLEMDRADAAQKYTPEYPGMLPQMDARIADLKQRLSKAVANTLSNKMPSLQSQGQVFEDYKQSQISVMFTRAKLAAAMRQRDQAKQNANSLPQTEMEYARLSRNTELAKALSASLETAMNNQRYNKDIAGPNVQVTQSALASAPVQPRLSTNLVLGALVGLFISLGLVVLIEHSDRRVRSIDDVRRLLPAPVISSLPELSHKQLKQLTTGQTPPQAVEAYGLARANLSLILRDNNPNDPWSRQVILVTSAVPGEGKSVTAAEMSRSIARSGHRVVLVDADMRQPTQNKLFGTNETRGLADVLMGKMRLEEAIVSSAVTDLSLLHSGTPGANPSDLICRQEMAKIVAQLRDLSDVVVIDTPACSVVADALFLAPLADTIIQVVGAGKVQEETVRDVASALRVAAPRTMVCFVNRAPKERSRGYHSYYYSGRGFAPEFSMSGADRALPPGNSEPRDGRGGQA